MKKEDTGNAQLLDEVGRAYIQDDMKENVEGGEALRSQSLKREQSLTGSVEREKKRVKFNFNYTGSRNLVVWKPRTGRNEFRKPVQAVKKGILKKKCMDVYINEVKSDLPFVAGHELDANDSDGSVLVDKIPEVPDNSSDGVIVRERTFTKEEECADANILGDGVDVIEGEMKINENLEIKTELNRLPESLDTDDNQMEPDGGAITPSSEDKDTRTPYSNNSGVNTTQGISPYAKDERKTVKPESKEGINDQNKLANLPPSTSASIRKRNRVVPTESKLTPEIVSVKDRRPAFSIKRNSGKSNSGNQSNGSGGGKRKCCVIDGDEPRRNEERCPDSKTKRDSRKRLKNPTHNLEPRNSKVCLTEENKQLKTQNKILEEKLKERTDRERDLTNRQRTITEKHQIENSKIIKENKKEINVLLSQLKSKERILAKLEKNLQKQDAEKQKIEMNQNRPNRPVLTRSVSAAGSIGRKTKQTQSAKPNKPFRRDESSRLAVAKQREDLSGKASGAQRRYVSKLEQMRRRIEEQQKEIASLNQRLLRAQNPNLKSLSQLSASVPTIYEGEKEESKSSRSTSGSILHENSKDEAFVLTSSVPDENYRFKIKRPEFSSSFSMADVDDLRAKSLDMFGPRYSSSDQQQMSLQYSSLVSLSDKKRELELAEENEILRAELQETRDHAELLEFRILEFTEGIQRATGVVHTTRDQSTNTSADDVTTPPPISEDLSLPLSVDSGLELNIETNKSRISEYRKSLSRLEELVGYSESSSIAQLSSLLDWVSAISGTQYEASMSPRSPLQKKMGVVTPQLESHRNSNSNGSSNNAGLEEEYDLMALANKLQESLLNGPKTQEAVMEETIAKLRSLDSSLSRLHSRVHSLSQENKELHEALHALHESHETRTEASGTESELQVNGKSPSLHSDLSDSESDDTSRPAKTSKMETSSSFQESGIFESSCEMINASTQTLQETDEYLVAALEGEKVTMCKVEYDSIVTAERSLREELEDLRREREKLSLECNTLRERIQKTADKESDTSEVLRAQLRLLEERLETTERLKAAYFDEKCELEEAENDARLLSQRLESQLEAAREMESLLSASLSQEQEFCRELQRRVREMHDIDKGRRMHEQVLEKESRFCRRREEALLVANDSQKSQLTFALYGLILAQFWRRLAASRNNRALVPYSPDIDPAIISILCTEDGGESLPFIPVFPCASECQKCLGEEEQEHLTTSGTRIRDLCDAFTQTHPIPTNHDFRDAMNNVGMSHDDRSIDNMEYLPDEPLHDERRPPNLESGLPTDEGLSDREEFYLEQIEALQRERKILREDYEQEQSVLIEQLKSMKNDLERLRESLEESQRDKCKLLFKLEEAESVISGSKMELEKRTKELKMEYSQSAEDYQRERKDIQERYEERIIEFRRTIEFHEQRFAALLQQYSVLQRELEPYFQGVSEGVDEYSTQGGGSHGKILTTKDLLSAVRELVKSESTAKQRLNDLEKKESAYRETINEADRIMSSHVTVYTGRIEELEASLEQKCSRIKQLEASEERLRNTMKSNWKTGEGSRITELLDRLIETENSELNLKERVWNLERNGKELQIKFAEAEKVQENLRSELRDQEELVQRLMTLSTENNALTTQLQEAHEAVRRMSDIQQSENYLKSRVEELEASEASLRETLSDTEHVLKQRERKFRDQMSNYEEELLILKSQLDNRSREFEAAKKVEATLRNQIDVQKSKIENLEKDLKETSSENICHETQHRSEVTKLRSQLKLANSQLTDLDTLNGELKERLEAAESAMKEVALQLEKRSTIHEKEVLSLNLQLTDKDSKLEEFEAQLQQISHGDVAGELDLLAASPLVNLRHTLHRFIENSQNCDKCRENQSAHLEVLTECLKTLNEIINGRSSQSDSEPEDIETVREENFTNEPRNTSTPLPSLPQEGVNETSSGEGETCSVYSLPLTIDSTTTDGGDNASSSGIPAVPPRPRRDAKRRKKVRRSPKKEGSLLDELEESATVENGSFYGQCPPSVQLLEDLEEKVRELEEVISKKDEELRLADGEANELQSRLMEEDEKLSQKTEEASHSKDALVTLRKQLAATVQEYESNKQELEARHKVDMNELRAKIGKMAEEIVCHTEKARLKDKIIDTLVFQIKCLLRASSRSVVINQIRKVSYTPSGVEEGTRILDFDAESVCQALEDHGDLEEEMY